MTLKSIQITLKQRAEPWMDGHILDLINQRDQALHNFWKSKIADDFKHFAKLRNKVQYSIRKAKRHFTSSDLCKILKSLGTSSKLKSGSTYIGVDVDGSTTFDKLKVADTFNASLQQWLINWCLNCRRQSTFSTVNLFINIINRKKLFKMLSLSFCSVKPKCVKCLKVYHLERLLVLMTYLQDLFVTVPKVLPTLFHTLLIYH